MLALRVGGGVGLEVGTAGHVWQSHIQDACRLTQAVRFVRKAMGTTSFLTRRLVGYATGRGVQTLVDRPLCTPEGFRFVELIAVDRGLDGATLLEMQVLGPASEFELRRFSTSRPVRS
jgi:hypothetical protein